MNNLLVWTLSENAKIIIASASADLATITCCDTIDIIFMIDHQQYSLAAAVTGCQLTDFKKSLESLMVSRINTIELKNSLFISKAKLGHLLVEIRLDQKSLAYFVVDLDTIQSWTKQLELLEVVMQENENEKKNRGKGCCG